MFLITKDPSSGSLVQCLDKITRTLLSCPLTWTWSVLWQHVPSYTVNYTHAQRVRLCCHNTDHIHVNGHDRTITVILARYWVKSLMMDRL